MANAFDKMAGRMNELTAKRLGRTATINGDEHIAVESHLLPELGPVAGDGINLVIFSAGYQPARGDEVIYKSQVYTVTRWLLFNGKPQIWIEEVISDD
ncbi:ATP-binding protein [Raoultella planticola]|nr:ATP-binding protein [Raoultella planticola]UNK75779.1 ATP-binding protein [Raoultella planticola]